ncbi:MAG: O-antigen ligase family protein [Acidobacteria bacterium]|nr:O-antigen ligase family protein [Acidobacteriota bacterium]MBV9147163.1 O-antigen ligase family protein [Acidobacteriota bacterium]MBV9437939.1 O-antigen ligase family protein [Acidobacteriota bacterium]
MIALYQRLRPATLVVFALAASGTILGIAIAQQRWFYAVPLVAVMLLVAWPVETTLGVYALLLPFDSISRLGNSPDGRALTWYAGALTTVALLGVGLLHDRLVRPPRAAKYWLCFLLLGILSLFWALDENVLAAQLPTVLGLFGLYFAASCFQISSREFVTVAELAILGGVAASLYSMLNFLSGIATIEARSSMIAGAQQADPNIFAASLLVSLTLALGLAFSKRPFLERAIYAASAAIIAVAVLLTMSRGALLALVGIACVFAYRYNLKRRLLLVLAAAPIGLLLLPPLFFSRFQNAFATGGAGRLDIWTAGLRAIGQFGLVGAGLENFPVAYQKFAGLAPVFRGYDRPAHNIYLQTVVELGIVGLAFLVAAVLAHIKEVRSTQSSLRAPQPLLIACEAMAIAMLIAAFFLGVLWQKSFWMVWIFCALVTHVVNCNRAAAMYGRPGDLQVLTHAA